MRTAVSLAAAVGVVALAAPHIAHAATTPTVTAALARHHVVAGARPSLTYLTAGRPSGSVAYLEIRRAGAGDHWFEARRLGSAGTVSVPAVTAGRYQIRVVITRAGHVIAASSVAGLRVTPPRPSSQPAPAQPDPSSSALVWLGKAALLVLGYLLAG